MIMMCHYRFISCEKCTTLVGDVVNGEGHVLGSGGYEKFLYFQCFREPTSAFKKISLQKKKKKKPLALG